MDNNEQNPQATDPQASAKSKKPSKSEEVEQRLEQIKLRTAEVQLQKAELELEQTEEAVAAFKAAKDARSRANKQRQDQLRKVINGQARAARTCSHRGGGNVGKHQKASGRGHSVLFVAVMPDERELIMCAICPLRVFSPNPMDKARKPRDGETAKQAAARVEKYEQDAAEFERLREHSQDKLTTDASTPMHCGLTFKFEDGEGRQVLVPSPCDSYLQGRDNREGVAA